MISQIRDRIARRRYDQRYAQSRRERMQREQELADELGALRVFMLDGAAAEAAR